MSASLIVSIISLVFSVFFGLSAFVMSIVNLVRAIKNDKKSAVSALKNSEILKKKNEILEEDSKRRAEHFEREEKMDKQKNAALEKMAQGIIEFHEQRLTTKILSEPEKQIIDIDSEPIKSEQ